MPRDTFTLHKKGDWNTLGMRGTCSPAALVTASGSTDQILPTPFADISCQTMVPFAHILWSSLWLGIATASVTRAGAFVRDQARKTPGQSPPTALRLAELWNLLQLMRTSVHQVAQECDALMRPGSHPELLATVGFAIKMNNLKISSSEAVVEIVHRALLICGIAGYRNDTKFSVGRQLRDALSGALMVGNDRIYATNASLLLVHKDG
jgi:acyl-CoA dehydrogenase